MDGQDALTAGIWVARVPAYRLGLIDPERVSVSVGIQDARSGDIRLSVEGVARPIVDRHGGKAREEIAIREGEQVAPQANLG